MNFLAEVFRKIPGVTNITADGANLIVTYILERVNLPLWRAAKSRNLSCITLWTCWFGRRDDFMPNYYVCRIDYENAFLDIRAELIAGRYRQGWGGSGCDLRINTAQTFPHGRARYDILSLMLDIKPNDRIIVPKVNVNEAEHSTDFFTIAVCTAPYRFAPFLPKYKDYGHIIGVSVKGSWRRNISNRYDLLGKAAYYIGRMIGNFAGGKFDSAISKVDDTHYERLFKEAVEYLIDPSKNSAYRRYPSIKPYYRNYNSQSNAQPVNNSDAQPVDNSDEQSVDNSDTQPADNSDTQPEKEDITLENLIENNLEQQRKFWQKVLSMQTLQPDDVLKAVRSVCAEIQQEIVIELFEMDGYGFERDDNYLVFKRDTIEDTIYEMNGVDALKIYVLLEKSSVSHAEALAQLEQYDAVNTRVFIALVEEFSDDIKASARQKRIMLINGRQFAELIIKYAIKSDS